MLVIVALPGLAIGLVGVRILLGGVGHKFAGILATLVGFGVAAVALMASVRLRPKQREGR